MHHVDTLGNLHVDRLGLIPSLAQDLDPRKAELLRQAQLRVLAKRKSAEKQSGESPPVGDEAKPAGAEAGPEDGAGKPSWQQKLDIALARRRSQNAAKEAGEGMPVGGWVSSVAWQASEVDGVNMRNTPYCCMQMRSIAIEPCLIVLLRLFHLAIMLFWLCQSWSPS